MDNKGKHFYPNGEIIGLKLFGFNIRLILVGRWARKIEVNQENGPSLQVLPEAVGGEQEFEYLCSVIL